MNGSQQRVRAVIRRSIVARTIISAVVIAACVAGAEYSTAHTLAHSGYLYLVFGVMVLLSFLYIIGLRGDYDYPKRLLRLQLLLDFLVVTAIVVSTGGIYSVFAFLYIIVVLEVGILLSQTESLMAASLSAMVLGAMVVVLRSPRIARTNAGSARSHSPRPIKSKTWSLATSCGTMVACTPPMAMG